MGTKSAMQIVKRGIVKRAVIYSGVILKLAKYCTQVRLIWDSFDHGKLRGSVPNVKRYRKNHK